MGKVDRSILLANDQNIGDFGDPDKLESSINHLADKVDENDNGFNAHKDAAELAHPDKSVTERKLADGSGSSRVIANSAINANHLNSSLLQHYGDIAVQAEFDKRGVNVQKFGAKGDGLTDDTQAFRDWADYVVNEGISNLFIPPGTYIVNLNVGEVLFNFADKHGIYIHAVGATIKRTLAFAIGQYATLFKFTNCSNIVSPGLKVDGVETDLIAETDGTNKGYRVYWFLDGNRNIYLVGQETKNNYVLALFGDGPYTNPKPTNEDIHIEGRVIRCDYGISCANTGDNAFVKLYGELNHRTYFVYGVKNHQANIKTKSPRTVSAKINSYQHPTENLDVTVDITFTTDAISRGKQNGGVDIGTQDLGASYSKGLIRELKLIVRATDEDTVANSYRPVIAFGAYGTEAGLIENVTIEANIKGWTGNGTYRPPIGWNEQTGYNADGSPSFNASYQEPKLKNIIFNRLVVEVPHQNKSMELSTTKLEKGLIIRNISGNGTPNVRNLSTDDQSFVRFDQVNLYQVYGSEVAQIDTNFSKRSLRHSYGRVSERSNAITQPSIALFELDKPRMVDKHVAGATSLDVPLIHIPDNKDYARYDFKGRTTYLSFEGTFEVRVDAAGGFQNVSGTKVVRFVCYNANGAIDSATTASLVVNADKSLTLRLANSTAGQLNFTSVQVRKSEW